MIKICVDCGKDFYSLSHVTKFCPICKEVRLHRNCSVCDKEFKVARPDKTTHTCGSDECVKQAISSKFTDERKLQQSKILAKRNKEYYTKLTPEQQIEYSNKLRENKYKQILNETPYQKELRLAKEKATKASWSDERKRQFSENVSKGNKKRYESMSYEDTLELLQKRFKHMTNIVNFNRDFILETFANKDGVIPYENRTLIKEYFNLKIGEAGINQLLSRKFNIECVKYPKVSFKELEIRRHLETLLHNYEVIYNDRNLIKPYEIDILYPALKIGIEYNGTYWHNKNNPTRENLKSKLCNKQGFKLFHIWEDTENEDLDEVLEFLRELRIL